METKLIRTEKLMKQSQHMFLSVLFILLLIPCTVTRINPNLLRQSRVFRHLPLTCNQTQKKQVLVPSLATVNQCTALILQLTISLKLYTVLKIHPNGNKNIIFQFPCNRLLSDASVVACYMLLRLLQTCAGVLQRKNQKSSSSRCF